MGFKSKFLNYIGQIRLYSIVDLVLLLLAINISRREFFGVILLHLGFILYLEFKHQHSYREKFPSLLWILLILAGILLYSKIAVIGFLIASFFYVEKKNTLFSPLAPVFRGLQYYCIIGGLIGFYTPISFLAGGLIFCRNMAGDFRDVAKDKKEGLKTLPIIVGFNRNNTYIHLVFLLITSLIWWYLSNLTSIWLLIAYIIEIFSYNITPR